MKRRRNPGGDVVTFLLCASGLIVLLHLGRRLFPAQPSPPPSPPDLDAPRFRPGVIDL